MSEKKSSLEEAKLNYEEIQKFAEEQAADKLKEQVAEKLQKLFEEKLNEDITINIDGSDNIEITKDGEAVALGAEKIASDNSGVEEMGLDAVETNLDVPSVDAEDSEEFIVSDEDDEIALDDTIEETIQNQNMEEMNKMTIEQEVAPVAAPVESPVAPGTEAPVAETPIDAAPAMPELLSKLDTLINIMMQQQGAPAPEGAEAATAGTEQEFEVIDDEANGSPAQAAPAVPMAPVQEDEEIEITDFEGDDANKNFIDEMEEQMLEIVDEDNVPMEGDSVEETRSLGFSSKRTGDKQLKLNTMKDAKGHHAPVTSLKESNNKKAQNESKLDELIKENEGLKSEITILQGDKKEFEEAFVDLRTQFNEMQLFNGKLALVNKVLMNGGLTTEEKIKICEQFDSVQTYEEANKLFKNIIKENNIKVGNGDATAKLKGASTNTAKPKSTSEPLYESEETRRAKKLAGIGKVEEEN